MRIKIESCSTCQYVTETTAAAIANAVAGLSAAMAAQLVWTPIDMVSLRLVVQGSHPSCSSPCRYVNGINAFRKIVNADGPKGLCRGFGISIVAYAPLKQCGGHCIRLLRGLFGEALDATLGKRDDEIIIIIIITIRPDSKTAMAVQGVSAAMAGGISALITMPLDTIKTRLQVLDGEKENGRRGGPPTIGQTVRNLVRGGWLAWCRGLGPRWASRSISATTVITPYEFLKRLSAKNQCCLM